MTGKTVLPMPPMVPFFLTSCSVDLIGGQFVVGQVWLGVVVSG